MASSSTRRTGTDLVTATSAASSNSGVAWTTSPSRCATLTRTRPPVTGTGTETRPRAVLLTATSRTPIVVVSSKISRFSMSRLPIEVSTASV